MLSMARFVAIATICNIGYNPQGPRVKGCPLGNLGISVPLPEHQMSERPNPFAKTRRDHADETAEDYVEAIEDIEIEHGSVPGQGSRPSDAGQPRHGHPDSESTCGRRPGDSNPLRASRPERGGAADGSGKSRPPRDRGGVSETTRGDRFDRRTRCRGHGAPRQ